MIDRLLIIAGVLGLSLPAYCEEPKKAVDPTIALINQLEKLDQQDTGYSGGNTGSSFLPLGYQSVSVMLISPSTPHQKSNAILSLVKLGSKAVPALLDHLDDDRKTKIVIRNELGGLFLIEHDKGEQVEEKPQKANELDPFGLKKQYTIRVGDLCYVALGQIVNRNYAAVRYIPSGNLGITSVPHCKKLRENLKKEWSNFTPEKHLASLTTDLKSKKGMDDPVDIAGASLRLVYYFPKEFESIAIAQLKQPTRKFIETLLYIESKELDEALLDLMSKTEDLQVSFALVDRLAGRGYDAQIEAFIQRMLTKVPAEHRKYIESFRHKLGFTRLHIAVELRSQVQIDAALKLNVDVNARSADGRTALDIAAVNNDSKTVNLLLNAKADANLKNRDGHTAMELAALHTCPDIVQRLASAQSEPLGFFSAVTLGKVDRVKELLKANPKLLKKRTVQGSGKTPLGVAATGGHEEVARVLLDAGADVNGPKDNLTPLYWAVTRNPNLKLVKLLIDRGAEVNRIEGYDKQAALHNAVNYNNIELVKLLLDAKADPTLKNWRGQSPLDIAKEKMHEAIVKLLEAAKK